MSEIGQIKQVDINQELEEAYLNYAMSVIVSRALPDVRDGLKPVHRRILYAMYDMGLHPDRTYKKSARIVGEVLGKYHPHGDSAVYDAMVRMAQDFSMRYALVDGQGNFGSVDGDSAAAMRYTEARLTKAALELLSEINKNTVDFRDNFDGSLKEPNLLPTRLPNLLINGADGIAVGMSTKIPPHNMGEICDAMTYMLEHWEKVEQIGVEDLMRFVQGPDFPTGGLIYRYRNDDKENNTDTILNAYATGRGRIVLQAKTHVEEMSRNRSRIVITELPYQTNKANLIERIANLAREGKIEGITDMRDESDRRGMRIVIETTRNVKPSELLATLFKYTPLRQTFGVIMLALVNGQPRLLSLKRCLQHFIEHRQEIIRRRSEYDLEQALARIHILEGLRLALKNLDQVIQIIRRSQRVDTAKKNLRGSFEMTEKQAQAVLDMRLARLAALERKKIETEYEALAGQINELEELLATPELVLTVIRKELQMLKEHYNDTRRTMIITQAEYTAQAIPEESLIPDGEIIITISSKKEIQRIMNTASQVRSGQKYEQIIIANNRYDLLLVNQNGYVWRTEIDRLPEKTGQSKGESLTQLLSRWERTDRAIAALDVPKEEQRLTQGYLIVVTRQGRVIRVNGNEIKNICSRTQLVNLDEADEVIWAGLTLGQEDLILVSTQGQAIRFSEEEVRPTGMGTQGVWGMKLEEQNDAVVGAGLTREGQELLMVSTKGMSKRTSLSHYSPQKRYGKGLRCMNLNENSGTIAVATIVTETDKLTLFTNQKNTSFDLQVREIPEADRYDSGQLMVELPTHHQMVHLLKWGERSAWPEVFAKAVEVPSSEAETNDKEAKPQPSKRRRRVQATKWQLSLDLEPNGTKNPSSNGCQTREEFDK